MYNRLEAWFTISPALLPVNIFIYHTVLELPVYFPVYTICHKSHKDINCICFVHCCMPNAKYNISGTYSRLASMFRISKTKTQ